MIARTGLGIRERRSTLARAHLPVISRSDIEEFRSRASSCVKSDRKSALGVERFAADTQSRRLHFTAVM